MSNTHINSTNARKYIEATDKAVFLVNLLGLFSIDQLTPELEDATEEQLLRAFNNSMDDLYVEYVKPASCEEVFVARGTKWQFAWCRYGNGRIDLGVYSFSGDVCWGYEAWKSGVFGQ
jgi:hypothetical protein